MRLIKIFLRIFSFCVIILCFTLYLLIINVYDETMAEYGKFSFKTLDDKRYADHLEIKRGLKKFDSDKWIVITSISQVTEDIKFMVNNFPEWIVLIVGDEKTPKNWKYKNCIFLSVEDQKNLNFSILSLTPYNSYTRKNIGYLYAIEKGAKFIYDTDDDNKPIKSKLDSFTYLNISSGLVANYNKLKNNPDFYFLNVYSFFGRSDVWPRGFPLELIQDFNSKDYGTKLCNNIRTPVIQQGLVNQDADVDAIYRMIYVQNKSQGLNVEFDPVAPPFILPHGVYCPFNSQDTLFHYRAFWALLLPITVTFRVTDIWRGYWAQRLLQLTGDYLGFYGPNARQHRNPHQYFKDFLEEHRLYIESYDLVKSLQNWTCSSNTFPDCAIDLTKLMVDKGFLLKHDSLLTEMWISDLQKIGYKFPELSDRGILADNFCRDTKFVSNTEKQINPEGVQMNSLKTLNKFCKPFMVNKLQYSGFSSASFQHTKNVILIVTFNHAHFNQIPLLQILYEPWFANVVYCASFPENLENLNLTVTPNNRLFQQGQAKNKFSYVNLTEQEMKHGYFGYLCLNRVLEMNIYQVDGYLVISDDALLNFWTPYELTKPHLHNACAKVDFSGSGMQWWNSTYGKSALLDLSSRLNVTSRDDLNLPVESIAVLNDILMMPEWCASDVYYVPQKSSKAYKILSQLFFESNVFLEIAIPKILAVLGWLQPYLKVMQGFSNAPEDLPGKYLWTLKERGNPFNDYDSKDIFMHPIKMSLFDQSSWRSGFCNTYVKAYFEAVSERGLE